MHRPTSVTISAVVAMVGGAMALGGSAAMFAVMRYLPRPGAGNAVAAGVAQAPGLVASALTVAVFGLAGIATGIGLLRMRPWARVSALVFAGLMLFVGVTMMAMTLALPAMLPPGAAPGISATEYRMLALPYVVPLLVGVWWLVLFNMARTREAFATPVPAAPSARPLGVSIIGWWMLLGGLLSIPAAIFRPAGQLFGVLVTGWTATVMFAVFAAIQIAGGWGLLKLQAPARLLAVGWFAFGAANSLLLLLLPGFEARMAAYGAASPWIPAGAMAGAMAGPAIPFCRGFVAVLACLMFVPIWYLVRARGAFSPSAA